MVRLHRGEVRGEITWGALGFTPKRCCTAPWWRAVVPHAGPALAPDWQHADSTHQSIRKLPPDLSDEVRHAQTQSTACIQVEDLIELPDMQLF